MTITTMIMLLASAALNCWLAWKFGKVMAKARNRSRALETAQWALRQAKSELLDAEHEADRWASKYSTAERDRVHITAERDRLQRLLMSKQGAGNN